MALGVTALGYIGIEVADPTASRSFAIDFLGLTDVSPSDTDLRFRADAQAWRIQPVIMTKPENSILRRS